jgi:hypothetical protein
LGTGQQGLAVGGGAGHRVRFAFIIESDYQLKGDESATVNRTSPFCFSIFWEFEKQKSNLLIIAIF